MPVTVHAPQRHAGADDEVLHVAGVNAVAHGGVGEARFPVFAFPAVRRVGVDAEAFVAVANLNEPAELLRAHRGGAGVDFVCETDAEAVGVCANLGRLFNETLLTGLDEVEARPSPETPRIAGGQFPAVGDAPKHRQNLQAQLGAQIHQAQDVRLVPLLEFLRALVLVRPVDERVAALGAGPRAGMHPECAVPAHAVEFEAVFLKRVADVLRLFESLAGVAILEHVVAWLCAGGPGLLGEGEEALEPLTAMLRPLDTAVINRFSHDSTVFPFKSFV